MNDRTALARMQGEVDSGALQRHLEWFSKVPRDTGGDGEDRAAAYLAAELDAVGVPVTTHQFDAFLSYPRQASLRVADGTAREFRCVTHSFTQSTPDSGLAAEIVAVSGSFAAARGKIALVDGLATPVTILQASQAGCAGIVFANEDRVIHNMIGTTIWGTPEHDQIDRLPQLPAVSVDVDAGAALKALAARGDGARVVMTARVETGWYRSKLPEVRIPGARDPDTFVLVGGHYCAWHVGITDNATGDACLLEMARLLWQGRAALDRSVRICWWPGHSHGRYSGSTWYADTFFSDLSEGGIAYYNIDSPGVKGASIYYCRHTCAELEAYCRSVIQRVTGQAHAPVFRPMRAADQSFLAGGMASFSAYPFLPDGHPDKRPWTGGSANAYWWHTEHDTLDKAEVSILATDVKVGLEAVWGLVTPGALPLDYRATARELHDAVAGFQPHAPDLDFAALLADTHVLIAALDRFDAQRPAGLADDPAVKRWNGTALRLGRILNPVMYTRGGRFHHDPAEWSPVLRATRRFTLPGLNKAESLPHVADLSEKRFLQAQLAREVNRARTAVRDAIRELADTR